MLDESIDEVGTISAPMASGGFINNDGGLGIAERLRLLQTCGVLGHVDLAVLNALGIKPPDGGVALDAGRLGEENDHE